MKDDRDDEFFTPAQESEIIEAIKKAEKNTSGEIRVHVENGHDDKDVLHRAGEVFATLGMDRTGTWQRRIAVHRSEAPPFCHMGRARDIRTRPGRVLGPDVQPGARAFQKWGNNRRLVQGHRTGGEKLKYYFPYRDGDVNELPDEISKGNV